MNKQEAIEEIKKQSTQAYDDFAIMRDTAIHIINQIEEPKKVVVPKFVAEWVGNSREHSFDFGEWLDYENQPPKVYNWLNPENKRQAELNVLALITLIVNGANAVEIEQEKLYTVEIPDPHSRYDYRYLSRNHKGIFLNASCDRSWKTLPNNQLTESEIKQDFEWAWQWAKEVEE